jgi:hypothetical protein
VAAGLVVVPALEAMAGRPGGVPEAAEAVEGLVKLMVERNSCRKGSKSNFDN